MAHSGSPTLTWLSAPASDALIILLASPLPARCALKVLANWSSLIPLRAARFEQDFSHIFKWLIKHLILMLEGQST